MKCQCKKYEERVEQLDMRAKYLRAFSRLIELNNRENLIYWIEENP